MLSIGSFSSAVSRGNVAFQVREKKPTYDSS